MGQPPLGSRAGRLWGWRPTRVLSGLNEAVGDGSGCLLWENGVCPPQKKENHNNLWLKYLSWESPSCFVAHPPCCVRINTKCPPAGLLALSQEAEKRVWEQTSAPGASRPRAAETGAASPAPPPGSSCQQGRAPWGCSILRESLKRGLQRGQRGNSTDLERSSVGRGLGCAVLGQDAWTVSKCPSRSVSAVSASSYPPVPRCACQERLKQGEHNPSCV